MVQVLVLHKWIRGYVDNVDNMYVGNMESYQKGIF